MILFEKPGRGNTEKTLQIAVDKAESLDAAIVIASNSGSTAKDLIRILKDRGSVVPVVVVTSVYGDEAARAGMSFLRHCAGSWKQKV